MPGTPGKGPQIDMMCGPFFRTFPESSLHSGRRRPAYFGMPTTTFMIGTDPFGSESACASPSTFIVARGTQASPAAEQ